MSNAQSMKIYSILSHIEQVLTESPKYKLGGGNNRHVIEIDELLDLLGDLKVTIPEDIRRASGIIAQEEAILSDAREQAEEMVTQAKEEAETLANQAQEAAEKVYNQSVEEYETLVSQESVYQEAVRRAETIQREATENAEAITTGARQYADDILADVQRYMNGYIKMLNGNREELNAQPLPESKPRNIPQEMSDERAQQILREKTARAAAAQEAKTKQSAPVKSVQPALKLVEKPEEGEEEPVRPARRKAARSEETEKPKKKGWFKRMLEGDDDEDEDDYEDEDWEEEAPKPKKKRHRLFEIVDEDEEDEDEE